MLSALRENGPVYLLDKRDGLVMKEGVVISVTNPPYGNYMNGTVTITANVEGEVMTFNDIPSCLVTAQCKNGLILSESKEALFAEMENLVKQSEQILESVPYHQKVVAEKERIKRMINPDLAKEQDREERLKALEQDVGQIKGGLSDIKSMLAQAFGGSSNAKN